MSSSASNRYSCGEEIANSLTHAMGAVLSIAAIVLLIVCFGNYHYPLRMVGFSIYGSTLLILYLASTLYHAVVQEKLKKIFRLMDHSSIFLLIAGTYTPVLLVAMRNGWGWTLFGLIWALAAGGVVFKFCFMDRYPWISLGLYTAMGWLAVIAVKPMLLLLPAGLLAWIVIGGLFYTLGIVFYVWKKLPYHHAIWHLFVLGGSMAHFLGILLYLSRNPV